MKRFFSLIIILIAVFYAYDFVKKYLQEKKPEIGRTTINYKKFRTLRFNHQYTEINPLPQIKNLESKYDPFVLCFRWKCITDAVEDRYNLPPGFIFAMMLQETNGIEFLLNSDDDGGAGLCHMQPSSASYFGLKIFNGCTKLVCTKDAIALFSFIQKNKNNRSLLTQKDERLDHLKNLDAVGRMLAYDMDGPQIDGLGPLRTALCRYTGSYNYSGYWRNVKRTMNLLQDASFMNNLEQKFNKRNPDLLINGVPGNWQSYLESYCRICENYGLSEYKLLPKYLPKNSEIVKQTYKKFLD